MMSQKPAAGADLRNVGARGGTLAVGAAGGIAAVGATALWSVLARLIPAGLRAPILAGLRPLAVGGRVAWARIPPWMRPILQFAGLAAGIDLLIDEGPDDRGVIQIPGTNDYPAIPAGGTVVSHWDANGVRFYRLSDGRLATQKKTGVWKVWRPRKPIVIFAGGARDIPTMLRADRALDKQAKKLDKMINRRVPRKRSPAAKRVDLLGADGAKIIRLG